MKISHLLTVLFLFLLVPASITWAQNNVSLSGTVTIEQDYRNVNFHSSLGNVKVMLPGNLTSSGSGTVTLGGTVKTEPSGNTEKEKQNNLKGLEKMVLMVAGTAVPIVAGSQFFNFSTPAGSTQPVKVNCTTRDGKTAEVSLKQLAIPPPPSTMAMPAGQPTLLTDQKIFVEGANIPVYAANNTSTLFQPTDKFFIKDAAGHTMEATKVACSPDQTVLAMPAGIQPGSVTITRQSGNRTDQVNAREVSLSLTSPNTNLKPGQSSTVTLTIDPKITERDTAEAMQIPIMTLDVKNLNPAVVDMVGGNLQVQCFPKKPNSVSSADWQATIPIIGKIPGMFDISASLYSSSDISTNAANTQKKALKTPEEFNKWIDGVKKYLQGLLDNAANEARKNQIVAAIQGLPYCTSDEDLELCKTTADNALRSFTIPEQNIATGLPAFIAYQAAADHLLNPANTDFIHTDILKAGLNYLRNSSLRTNTGVLGEINNAVNACNDVDMDYSPITLSGLQDAIKKIADDVAYESFVNKFSTNPTGKTELHEKTIIGFLNPFSNTLWGDSAEKGYVLGSFGATKQEDGKYRIYCTSYTNKPVTLFVNVVWTSPVILNKINIGGLDVDMPPLGLAFNSDNKKDSTEKKDNNGSQPKYVGTYKDSTGTAYVLTKDARCALVMKAHTEECAPNRRVLENSGDSTYYGEDNPEYSQPFGPQNKDNNGNQFMKLELYDHFNCVGGSDYCKAKVVLLGLKYIYADKNWKKLVNVIKFTGW